MNRKKIALKMAIRKNLIFLVATIVGIILFLIGCAAKSEVVLYIGGFVALFGGLFCYLGIKQDTNDYLRTTCEFCGESMKGCAYRIDYNEAKDNYDNQGNFRSTTVSYNVSCTCPHCHSDAYWDDKLNGKNISNAKTNIQKYVNRLYRGK